MKKYNKGEILYYEGDVLSDHLVLVSGSVKAFKYSINNALLYCALAQNTQKYALFLLLHAPENVKIKCEPGAAVRSKSHQRNQNDLTCHSVTAITNRPHGQKQFNVNPCLHSLCEPSTGASAAFGTAVAKRPKWKTLWFTPDFRYHEGWKHERDQ